MDKVCVYMYPGVSTRMTAQNVSSCIQKIGKC